MESKRRTAADQFAEMLPPGEWIELMVGGSLRSTCVSPWSNNDTVVAMELPGWASDRCAAAPARPSGGCRFSTSAPIPPCPTGLDVAPMASAPCPPCGGGFAFAQSIRPYYMRVQV